MHYNENAGRAQATTALGEARYSISYPRSKQDTGGYTVHKKLVNSTFSKFELDPLYNHIPQKPTCKGYRYYNSYRCLNVSVLYICVHTRVYYDSV